jgi:hypothetical protein
MTDNLKTLKDLVRKEDGDFIRWCSYDELKAEAVKWVKFQEDIQMNNPAYMTEYRLNIQWIINFFNLTEEDLKQQEQKDD